MRKYLLILGVLTYFLSFSQSSKEKVKDIDVRNTKAVFLGSTGRFDQLSQLASKSSEKLALDKKNKKVHPNFFGRGLSKVTKPDLEHLGPDPIRQTSFPSQRTRVIIEPIVNRDGLTNGSDPQDPTGAIGSNYYLQAINATEICVYQKDGTPIDTLTGNSLWASIGETSLGDPIILFDQEVDRWLVTEFADPANLLVAISETNDPLGSYFVYSFSTPEFPDYPKYGIWNNAYTVTTNEGGASTLHQYFIDRSALIAGEESVTIQRVAIGGNSDTEAGFYVTTPVDWNGSTAPPDNNPMVVKINDSSWGEVANDVVEIYSFDVDFETPANTTATLTSIITTPFDGFPCADAGLGFACIPQKDGLGLDGIPEVIMNVPHYRNFGTHESMVLNFITDATNGENISGIRWMELRRSGGGDWTLYQESTLAPDDDLHRFMGAIAMDGNGNIGLAYNVSGENDFVGIRFTGRFADDPLGLMSVQETEVVAGTNVINSSTRFGDYAQMNVDPVDDMTFWYTSEYAGNGINDAVTRIFSFQLERRANDLAATNMVAPAEFGTFSNAESITVEINNTGSNPVSDFDVQLLVDDNLIVTDNINTTLNPQDAFEHTFSVPVDLSMIGEYKIGFNIQFAEDEESQNDLFESMINSVVALDAAVEAEIESEVCTESLLTELKLTNKGGNTLTTLDINLLVNDQLQETIPWTGTLITNESEQVEVEFQNFDSGINELKIAVANPNGGLDQDVSNDEVSVSIDFIEDSDKVIFSLITDLFPTETTWNVTNSSNEVVASGGPYAESSANIVESICLQKDQCYMFSILDAESDGICCDFGEGSYSLIGSDGEVIFESDGQFGSSQNTEICVGFVCNLSVEVSKVDATANESGSINISASGSVGYQYSIDGGITFGDTFLFNDLEPGIYEVVVTSDDGACEFTETLEIVLTLDLNESNEDFKIWPNPSQDGIFRVSLENETIDGFLIVEVLSSDGKIVQSRKFSRYGKSFEGTISLYAYPEGMYFLKFKDLESNRLIKIIKQ